MLRAARCLPAAALLIAMMEQRTERQVEKWRVGEGLQEKSIGPSQQGCVWSGTGGCVAGL